MSSNFSHSDFFVVIPAIKKNVAFTDDLIKKLAGTPLIVRTIEKAFDLTSAANIVVVTDSQEIRLIAGRNKVQNVLYNCEFITNDKLIWDSLFTFLRASQIPPKYILMLSPYAPLVSVNTIKKAIEYFVTKGESKLLIPVVNFSKKMGVNFRFLNQYLPIETEKNDFVESVSFEIISLDLISKTLQRFSKDLVIYYQLTEDTFEIKNHKDWWVCEKQLNRKRIIFNVICNYSVGTGHVYRALSLAHELADHEVLFVCSESDHAFVEKIVGDSYWLEKYQTNSMLEEIIELAPDLVVNDILSTELDYIIQLKERGIKVLNFEDLGDGARHANLVINELFEQPHFNSANVLWGSDYFFLRDEFYAVQKRTFQEKVNKVLITFGGTDEHNLGLLVLKRIYDFCEKHIIYIKVVCGPGNIHVDSIRSHIEKFRLKNIELICKTATMSEVMEDIDLAITSNGRTVYELAQMNIPSIVISQHAREYTHTFSSHSNGFVNLGIFQHGETFIDEVVHHFELLCLNNQQRYELYKKMLQIDFKKNKDLIVYQLKGLIDLRGQSSSLIYQ